MQMFIFRSLIVAAMLVGMPVVLAQAETTKPVPRNVVFIMLDDADYFDFGFLNRTLDSPDIATPNIDALRRGGRLMNHYYCASSVCSPTRVSILTGNTPIQHGATDAWATSRSVNDALPGMTGLPQHIPQLGKAMQSLGLRTAHFGKWHVGFHRPEFRPDALGWDEYLVHFFARENPKKDWSGVFDFVTHSGSYSEEIDHLDAYFAAKVRAFIAESVDRNQRFFVNFWPLTPHRPWAVPKGFNNSETQFDLTTRRGKLCAMMHRLDADIGLIVDQLTELGILKDTLVMVTSDNGGQAFVQHPGHLRGSKATLFNGGTAVPLIAHWPNGIAADTTNPSVMVSYDVLPTLVDLLGGDDSALDSQIDGRSKAMALSSDQVLPHDPIISQVSGGPRRTDDERAQRYFAYREGDYKLIKIRRHNDLSDPNAYAMYDIEKDPFETTKLNRKEPARFAKMKKDLLVMRQQRSQFHDFPSTADRTKVSVPFDPRLDVNSKDMTLTMRLAVPASLPATQNLFTRDGSQALSLTETRTLKWTLSGVGENKKPISRVLSSEPLANGDHEIVLRIRGWKHDLIRAELLVDGTVADQLDVPSPMIAIQHSISETILGDNEISLSDVSYFNNYFYDDELPEQAAGPSH